MADTFPTKNWQWPDGDTTADKLVAAMTALEMLRRDRDELLAALVKAVGFHWQDVDYDPEAAQDERRALIARIRAGK